MNSRPRRYLALGDSYTIGEGVAEAERWPARLAEQLQAAGLALDPVRYLATTGWSSDELDQAISATALPGPWDLVSLLIGVNDQYRGHPAASRQSLIAGLIERSVMLAGDRARVLVVSIPDWSVTTFARDSGRDLATIAGQIDAYNAMTARLCASAGVAWIDVTACSRAHPYELAADGLHPGAAQYLRWAEILLPKALLALQERSGAP